MQSKTKGPSTRRVPAQKQAEIAPCSLRMTVFVVVDESLSFDSQGARPKAGGHRTLLPQDDSVGFGKTIGSDAPAHCGLPFSDCSLLFAPARAVC